MKGLELDLSVTYRDRRMTRSVDRKTGRPSLCIYIQSCNRNSNDNSNSNSNSTSNSNSNSNERDGGGQDGAAEEGSA